MSLPRITGALLGALALLLGLLVLAGWAVHSTLLIQVAPDLPPMPWTTAAGFVLSGLALAGVALNVPRWVYIGSAVTAILAASSLVAYMAAAHAPEPWHMSPITTFCFMALSAGFVLTQVGPLDKSSTLGIAGSLAASIGVGCGVTILWGSGDVLCLGGLTRMAVHTAGGFIGLGMGAVAVALDMSIAGLRQAAWAPLGAALFVATSRIALLQVFWPASQPGGSIPALPGALLGAVIFAAVVHFALKASLQRELLRTANRRLLEEMLERVRAEGAVRGANEELERRVEERTASLKAANQELRNEIGRRERVEDELRTQKEILQSIVDNVPAILRFTDKEGRVQIVNREWDRVMGYSLEEMVNREVEVAHEVYPDPDERRRVMKFIADSTSQWDDFRTRIKDGRVIDTSWAVVRLSNGDTISIGQDVTARKQAERDLRRQKELLQTIFDHIPAMVGFIDQNYELSLVNREWERTLGWSLQEHQNRNVDILIDTYYSDPESRKRGRDFVANSDRKWVDFKTTARDGQMIDTSWAMLHLSDGSAIGIGQDITQRKRADEALRESEERFRQLAENIQDVFWIKSADFKQVLYLSPIYESLTGRNREERYQERSYEPFLEIIIPEDREKMAEILRRGAETEFDIEYRIRRSDGAVRWFRDRGFPVRDPSGQIYRIAGTASDITEHKLAEEALRESEERFRQLAENIREVFWLRSPDFKQVLYVSPMYEKVCGRSAESLYAAGGDLAAVHPDDHCRVIETMQNHDGREFEVEYRIITKDRDVRWVRDRGFPIRNQAGQIYRIGGVAEDITDRKEAEDLLKASSDQLRDLSVSLQSAREQEATRIAHQIHDELGGVLTGLRWELEALEKGLDGTPDAGKQPAMRERIATMLGLTDTTINVVRRIASDLRPSILDDLGLVEALEWQTQQFQARTGIECHCDCALQSLQLGNQQSTAVFRIVQEGLTNILRHAQATRVCVAMTVKGGVFILTLTDNGRGISAAEKIGKNSLGLLGMRERAHLIGARLDLAGFEGRGTTLRVCVPLEEGAR